MKKSLEELVGASAKQLPAVTDAGGGMLVALAIDLDGSVIGLGSRHHGYECGLATMNAY
jgi:hypothetical protein